MSEEIKKDVEARARRFEGEAPPDPRDISQRICWQFYWPLALMAVAMVAGRQFQNATLARYDEAVRELATLAYAHSVFFLFNATQAFVPQMANVLGRTRGDRRVCLRFTVGFCLILSLPLAFLGWTPPGSALVAKAFKIDGQVLANVGEYLRYFAPLIVITGLRQYYTGLLVQARRTGLVAALNVVFLGLVLGTLMLGMHAGWRPVTTLALAQVVPAAIYALLAFGGCAVFSPPVEADPEGEGGEEVTYRKALDFFWPVALTGTMFALTRPVIYAAASRTENAEPTVAALRVGFDLGILFHMTVNQLRHLVVTLGHRGLEHIRRFMVRVVVVVTGLMIAVALTPLSGLLIGKLLGVKGEVRVMAGHVLLILCCIPVLVSWRNYYHGLALINRRTFGISVGGVCRTLVTLVLAFGALHLGILNHAVGAGLLGFAFLVDGLAVVLATRGWRRAAETSAPSSP
ncbi:MAG: hypothetical protein ACYTGB_02690 [Planctomycetota bacterium]|jgi:hypothetical protein